MPEPGDKCEGNRRTAHTASFPTYQVPRHSSSPAPMGWATPKSPVPVSRDEMRSIGEHPGQPGVSETAGQLRFIRAGHPIGRPRFSLAPAMTPQLLHTVRTWMKLGPRDLAVSIPMGRMAWFSNRQDHADCGMWWRAVPACQIRRVVFFFFSVGVSCVCCGMVQAQATRVRRLTYHILITCQHV